MTDKDLIDDLKTANQGLYELKDKLEAQLATATAQVERMREALDKLVLAAVEFNKTSPSPPIFPEYTRYLLAINSAKVALDEKSNA